ncbi:MAG TPA: hypothetical protein VNG90_00415 [Candidatus Acidoferrum sp.]|nr:hypothetical protein [Candidatus Acidoferrum sp.]
MRQLANLKNPTAYRKVAVIALKTCLDFLRWAKSFLRANWIGTVVVLLFTIFFFWPVLTRIGSYIEGGDEMFNAWTLSRNYHCLMHDGCPKYVDGNIYFPNKNTMLYSEAQLSAGLVTLPLYWINDNPIFTYNVWTVASFFLAGWFMYLLAKYLSKGKELLPTLAGLAFAYAPIKMSSIGHLQNLSIFYLPLIILLVLKFFETKRRHYLIGLFIALVLQFYASWYQMIFVLIAVGILLFGSWLFKLTRSKQIILAGAVLLLAALSTLPLALQYVSFSKQNHATFGISDQLIYESSLKDYTIPHGGTLLGKLYYKLNPGTQANAFNLDSFSYHGVVLYAVALMLLALVWHSRKQGTANRQLFGMVITLAALALVGFVISLGPLLKIGGAYKYGSLGISFPLPWLLVDKLLPQLEFIRAIGRASVLVLFVLCCFLGYFALSVDKTWWLKKIKWPLYVGILVLVCVEILPFHQVPMTKLPNNYNLSVPAVYKYIKAHKEIDDIVTVEGDSDYPNAPIPEIRAEWVLWAGYDNRNTFNGYSGYEPPTYMADYILFKTMSPQAAARMKQLGLKYVIIDKQLSTTEPWLRDRAEQLLAKKIYEDKRYALFKI